MMFPFANWSLDTKKALAHGLKEKTTTLLSAGSKLILIRDFHRAGRPSINENSQNLAEQLFFMSDLKSKQLTSNFNESFGYFTTGKNIDHRYSRHVYFFMKKRVYESLPFFFFFYLFYAINRSIPLLGTLTAIETELRLKRKGFQNRSCFFFLSEVWDRGTSLMVIS